MQDHEWILLDLDRIRYWAIECESENSLRWSVKSFCYFYLPE
jgi:hypothetical protein